MDGQCISTGLEIQNKTAIGICIRSLQLARLNIARRHRSKRRRLPLGQVNNARNARLSDHLLREQDNQKSE
jgi:hypothetical protein